jgi:mRNA-degrading endonuclease RelE of RelBE toxin-antitoxin system
LSYAYRLDRGGAPLPAEAPEEQRNRILRLLSRICEDPVDSAVSLPLHGGAAGMRRSRAGGTRIVFEVFQDQLLVHVTVIAPRGDVYKR